MFHYVRSRLHSYTKWDCYKHATDTLEFQYGLRRVEGGHVVTRKMTHIVKALPRCANVSGISVDDCDASRFVPQYRVHRKRDMFFLKGVCYCLTQSSKICGMWHCEVQYEISIRCDSIAPREVCRCASYAADVSKMLSDWSGLVQCNPTAESLACVPSVTIDE
jgi:hypothetical protein